MTANIHGNPPAGYPQLLGSFLGAILERPDADL